MKKIKRHTEPTNPSGRHIILDALRGFALLGICLANYPEFSLYTFQSPDNIAAMPSAGIDRIVHFLQYIFIDGKFYTLFSILFGIGFSIILSNAIKKGTNGLWIFYRRMAILACIGFLHLMLLWSGDILLLYALLGMLLPLFRNVSNKGLLMAAMIFLLLPIAVDTVAQVYDIQFSALAVQKQWFYCNRYGITEENFGYWLRDADNYPQVFQFLIQGAWERLQEFIDGNRYFKVLGLFLLGFYIGRNKLYKDLESRASWLKKIVIYGVPVMLPLSALYAWSGSTGYPYGKAVHTIIYTISVYPMGIIYIAGVCLLFLKTKEWRLWKLLAAPGRMALTNYIGQSIIGMFLFYGIGCGLGASLGLFETEIIAFFVFVLQVLFSLCWLKIFRFGPLEWIWRMLTYGQWLNPR